MKKNIRKLTVCLLAIGMTATAAGALAACGSDEEIKLPDYNYDFSKPAEDFGDGILIDGKVDEALWSEGRAFVSDVAGTNVTYKMMSHFGAHGVYFGWDVKDDAVCYSPNRPVYTNSGVELYVGSMTEPDMSYEIDVNAAGISMLRKFVRDKWAFPDWFGDLHCAVVVNGELNSGNTEGYTAELYIPYHLLNSDNSDTAHDELYVNPVFIRGYARETTDPNDKLWYSFGKELRDSTWGPADGTWYTMSKEGGLLAEDVTVTQTEHGTVSGNPFIVPGDKKYTVTARPDAGYYVSKILVSGEEVATDKITFGEGVATYGHESANGFTEGFEVSAQFAAFPAEKNTLSGTVSVSPGSLSNPAMYALYRGGARFAIPVGSDGTFSVELPAVDGEYEVHCSADGCVAETEYISVKEGDATFDFELLNTSQLPLEFDDPTLWDYSDLDKGDLFALSDAWLTGGYHKSISGTKVYASANLILPTDPSIADPRVGFVFKTEYHKVYVCFLYEKGVYGLQIIVNGEWGVFNQADVNLVDLVGPEVETLAHGNGVPVQMLYDGGKISVWVNGKLIYDKVTTKDPGFGIGADTVAAPGVMTTKHNVGYHNLAFNTTGFDGVKGYIQTTSNQYGTVTVEGGKTTYNVGDTIKFNVTPKNGFECTGLTLNGEDVKAELNNGAYTVTVTEDMGTVLSLDAAFEEIIAEDDYYDVTFNVTLHKLGIAAGNTAAIPAGTEVKLQGLTQTYTATSTAGAAAFTHVPKGAYKLQIAGYDDLDVTIADGTAQTVTVNFTIATSFGDNIDNFDTSKLNDGELKYSDTPTGESHIKTTLESGDGDFFFSSKVKKGDLFTFGDFRMGYTLYRTSDNATFHATLAVWGEGTPLRLDVPAWTAINPGLGTKDISATLKAAWEGDGMELAVARYNGVLLVLGRAGTTWEIISMNRSADCATENFNMGFAGWHQGAPGATWTDITFQTSVPADISDMLGVQVSTTADNGTLTVAPTAPKLGQDITLTYELAEGTVLSMFKVNSQDRMNDLTLGTDGKYTLTLSGYGSLNLEVEAACEALTDGVAVSLNIKVLNMRAAEAVAIPDGARVTLTSDDNPPILADSVTGGVVTFGQVPKNTTYTLTVENYEPTELAVEEAAIENREITVTYKLFEGTNAAFDTTDTFTNGNVTVNKTGGTVLYFAQTVKSNEDFFVLGTFKNFYNTTVEGQDIRLGFEIGTDTDGDGNLHRDWWGGSSESFSQVFCITHNGGETQIPPRWVHNHAINRENAIGEMGVVMGVARVSGKLYGIYTKDDGSYELVEWTQITGFSGVLHIGLTVDFNIDCDKVADIADLKYEVVAQGTVFSNQALAAAFAALAAPQE